MDSLLRPVMRRFALPVLGLCLWWYGIVAQAQSPVSLQVDVTRSDEQAVVLELQAPIPELIEKEVDGERCYLLKMENSAQTEKPAWPQVPTRLAMLGLPPGAVPEIEVLAAHYATVTLALDICPAPTPILRNEPGPGDPLPGNVHADLVYVWNDDAYSRDEFYPAELARVADEGYLRDQRFLQLALQPFQYNPARRELRVVERLEVAVHFGAPQDPPPPAPVHASEASFEAMLAHSLLNYDVARGWRHQAPEPRGETRDPWALPSPAFKVTVDQNGVYRLTYSHLLAAGLPLTTLDPQTFQLFDRGTEMAIEVIGEGDGHFDPGDELRFYGQAVDTRYTGTNVYWLTFGSAQGRRMAVRPGTPTGTAPVPASFMTSVHVEEDRSYRSQDGSSGSDHWYWDYIHSSIAVSRSFPITLPHVSAETYPAALRARLWSLASSSHVVRFYLNNHLITETSWSGSTAHQLDVPFPSAWLQADSTVVIQILSQNELVWIDWLEVDYRRTYQPVEDQVGMSAEETGTWQIEAGGFGTAALALYDITEPTAPGHIVSPTIAYSGGSYNLAFEDTILEPAAYLALAENRILSPLGVIADTPSDLSSPANGADYLVISHADWLTEAQELADYRLGQQGISRTLAVDVEDIYDEFNDGELSAEAIRDFLHHAYYHWQPPAPAFVLLLGDGHYDFRNYSGQAPVTRIPPYLVYLDDSLIGESAADNQYGCLNGEDRLPEVHVGRLPADSRAEAQAMVDKIMAYETGPAPTDWSHNALFAADNPDGGGDFHSLSDEIVDQHLPPQYTTARVYLGETCSSGTACRQEIIATLDGGCAFSNYVGHGTVTHWAAEQMLRVSDVSGLANNGRLPVQLSFTCVTGYFLAPTQSQESIDESLALVADRGAIASWSNADYSYAFLDRWVHKGWYKAVFDHGLLQAGPAAGWAKVYYHDHTTNPLLLERKHLFGDPALKLAVWGADLGVSQAVEGPDGLTAWAKAGWPLTYTVVFTNNGPVDAAGTVLTDSLPAGAAYAVGSLALPPGTQAQFDDGSGSFTYVPSGTVDARTRAFRLVWTEPLAAGTDGQVGFGVRVAEPYTSSAPLINEVLVVSGIPEINQGNNQSTSEIAVPADLCLSEQVTDETGSHTWTMPGHVLTYTLDWGNKGPNDAPGMILTATLPAGPAYVVGSLELPAGAAAQFDDGSGGFSYTPAPGPGDTDPVVRGLRLLWLDPVPSGNSGLSRFQVKSSAPYSGPSLFVSQATIGSVLADPMVTDNGAETHIAIVDVDDLTPRSVRALGTTLTNPEIALTITGHLTAPVSAEIGTAPLMSVTLASSTTLQAILPAGSLGPGMYGLSLTSGSVPLSVPEAFTVTPPAADLWLLKKAARPGIRPDRALTYTLAFGNRGPSSAVGMRITETVPLSTAYKVGSLSLPASVTVEFDDGSGTFAYTPMPNADGTDPQVRALRLRESQPLAPDLLPLVDLDGNNNPSPIADQTVSGAAPGDRSGMAVMSGDLNGDGRQDLIVGAPFADGPGGDEAGAVYAIFGRVHLTPTFDLGETTPDLVVYGSTTGDQIGQSLACGDLNADGVDDLIIGARDGDMMLSGKAFVLFGRTTLSGTLDLSQTPADLGVYGDMSLIESGFAVASGDLNGDGRDDLIIGAPWAFLPCSYEQGDVYVILGREDLGGLIDLAATPADLTVCGDDGYSMGLPVASGDLNGDGLDDIIAGNHDRSGPGSGGGGRTYVIFGRTPLAGSVDLSDIVDVTVRGGDVRDASNLSLATGDVNGDGIGDLVIGGDGTDTPGGEDAGEVYLVFGSADLPAIIDLDETPADLTVRGQDANDYLGGAAACADLNGDGFDDLLLGAYGTDSPGRPDAGQVYVLLGRAGIGGSVNLGRGEPALVLRGSDPGDGLGLALGGGDLNGDGQSELIAGAPEAGTAAGERVGETYVIVAPGGRRASFGLQLTRPFADSAPIANEAAIASDTPDPYGVDNESTEVVTTCVPISGSGFVFSPTVPVATELVTFRGMVAAGRNVVYHWDFGDGHTDVGRVVSHAFAHGTWTVVLSTSNLCSSEIVSRSLDVVRTGPYRLYLPLILMTRG